MNHLQSEYIVPVCAFALNQQGTLLSAFYSDPVPCWQIRTSRYSQNRSKCIVFN